LGITELLALLKSLDPYKNRVLDTTRKSITTIRSDCGQVESLGPMQEQNVFAPLDFIRSQNMIDEQYVQKIESACIELIEEGKNPVRAGQITERAGIDNASKLGTHLRLGSLDFEEIEYNVIQHEDEKVSNEYRIYR
jgi:hypothetical protein